MSFLSLFVGYFIISIITFVLARYIVGLGQEPFIHYLMFLYFALTWPILLFILASAFVAGCFYDFS